MEGLRWILLVIGILVIAVIWLSSRRKQSDEPPELTEAVEPAEDGVQDDKLVALHVAAEHDLDGHALFEALENAGLQFGDMDIYHSIDDGRVLFSVANMLEPGTFGAAATPGIALFMTLEGDQGGVERFDRMLDCARTLAMELDAQVLDARRDVLTDDAEAHIRDDIMDFESQGRGG